MFATRIDKEILKQLKHLSIDVERPVADLAEEAIINLLKKYQKISK